MRPAQSRATLLDHRRLRGGAVSCRHCGVIFLRGEAQALELHVAHLHTPAPPRFVAGGEQLALPLRERIPPEP